MIGNLFKFIGSIPKKILKRTSIISELDLLYSNIRLNISPVLETLRFNINKKINGYDDMKLSSISFFRGSQIEKDYKTVSVLLTVIHNVIFELNENKKKIEALIKDVPNTMSTEAMTTNQSLMLNIIDNIKVFTEMSSDIIMIVTERYSESEPVFSQAVLEQKKDILYDYYNILTAYRDIKKSIVDLDNIVITNDQAVATILADKKIVIPDRITEGKGFVGNPWYHLGLFIKDFGFYNYNRTIKNKEYVELLLAEYELKQQNQYDPKLETLIENAKDIINEYELKIEKYNRG